MADSTRARGGKGGYEPAARIQERRRRVWELSVQGLSQGEIARQLGISQSAVSRILSRMVEEDADLLRRQRQLVRAMDMDRLLKVYRESMEAYERSKAPQTIRRRRQSTRNNVSLDMTEVVVREREGDPRHLARAMAAMQQLRELVRDEGSDAARSTGQRSEADAPSFDAKRLNDQELERFIMLAKKAAGLPGSDSAG